MRKRKAEEEVNQKKSRVEKKGTRIKEVREGGSEYGSRVDDGNHTPTHHRQEPN